MLGQRPEDCSGYSLRRLAGRSLGAAAGSHSDAQETQKGPSCHGGSPPTPPTPSQTDQHLRPGGSKEILGGNLKGCVAPCVP